LPCMRSAEWNTICSDWLIVGVVTKMTDLQIIFWPHGNSGLSNRPTRAKSDRRRPNAVKNLSWQRKMICHRVGAG
jgi:hypothetical protein